MRTRNRIIICLIVVGLALFGVVHGIIMPQIEHTKKQYMEDQQNPLSHDIENALQFKSKYMGDNSNIINLFNSLPLNNVGMSFRLIPDKLTAEINYKSYVKDIGEDQVNKALIYNATASFALIDNLEAINFNFIGTSYKVSRNDVANWYGVKLSTLLKKDVWEKTVQNKLKDSEYVLDFIKKF